MPPRYRRRRTRRRPTTSKSYGPFNTSKFTPQSAYSMAVQAAKDIWYIKGLVNSETMHSDQTCTLGNNQNAIFNLTALAQGDNDNNRTANSILLKNIYIRGLMQINSAVTGQTRISMALVKDTQQVSDTAPSISDIFTTATDPDSLLKTGTFGRFKILYRKTYILTPTTGGGRSAIDLTKYWKIHSHVRYNGTASTDIQKNGYYLVFISSEATNYPTITFNTRIGFHDN